MPYIVDHQRKFDDLKYHLHNQEQIRLSANGGNSILFSYPPSEEKDYIKKAFELYKNEAEFIDISKLFVNFIKKDGWEDFKSYYRDFQNTTDKVFDSNDTSTDLFDLIINAIKDVSAKDKIPMIIRTGALLAA